MIDSPILLTGGMGYIGSHVYVALKESGFEPIILDNLSNSYERTLKNIKRITGEEPYFINADLRDKNTLASILEKFEIKNVIHLAAKKSVFESTKNPISYLSNNIRGLNTLLNQLRKTDRETNFIFSSSACVYASSNPLPFKEDGIISATNPYGLSKIYGEKLIKNQKRDNFKFAILRYFNPAGAHFSGYIGQDEKYHFSNLFSVINEVATESRQHVPIYGNDYDTPDGTCVRDFFHVMDLADGHVSALKKINDTKLNFVINLGSGNGYSVMQIINTFKDKINIPIPYKNYPRRAGDIATMISSTDLAKIHIDWKPKYNLDDICQTSYLWRRKLNNE